MKNGKELVKIEEFRTDSAELEQEFKDIVAELETEECKVPEELNQRMHAHIHSLYQRRRFFYVASRIMAPCAAACIAFASVFTYFHIDSARQTMLQQDTAYLEDVYETEQMWLELYEFVELMEMEDSLFAID